MPVDQIANQRPQVRTGSESLKGGAGKKVDPPDTGDMNDDFSIVPPTEREPGVPFVGNPAIRVNPQASLDQDGLNPVELAKLR